MAEFRFAFQAVQADDDGYCYPRWDQAVPITVVAPSKPEAIEAAAVALGPADRHRHWLFRLQEVVDHRVPDPATSAPYQPGGDE